jgi:hypothetical protein
MMSEAARKLHCGCRWRAVEAVENQWQSGLFATARSFAQLHEIKRKSLIYNDQLNHGTARLGMGTAFGT